MMCPPFAGTPCVFATFFLPTLVSAGVGAILFPMVNANTPAHGGEDLKLPCPTKMLLFFYFQFVLVATASRTEEAIAAAEWGVKGAALVPPLPVFGLARAQA